MFSKPRRRLPPPFGLYQSAIGKKWVMGVTGIMLMGYVLVHMIGNLHIYQGPADINAYGEALRDLGGHLAPRTWVLWVLRAMLIAAFVFHIHAAYALTRMNHAARPGGYRSDRTYVSGTRVQGRDNVASYAARTMRWTGVIILLYVFFHLADLTWGWVLGSDYIRGDVYNNVSRSLSNIPVAIIYIIANVALALHLYHGAWSLFQSLGLNNPRFNRARRTFATAFALVILVGNLSFPILTLAGVVSQDTRTTPCAVHHGVETDTCLPSGH